ncbi:hypothetical protein [Paenibacillus sp. sgz500992]
MKMSIGQTIEIIYLDKLGEIATCLSVRAPRVFLLSNILGWHPVREQRYA